MKEPTLKREGYNKDIFGQARSQTCMHLFFGSYEILSIKLWEETTKQESREPREQRSPPGTKEEMGIKLSREAGGQPGPWGQKAHERLFPRDTTGWIPRGVKEYLHTCVGLEWGLG